MKKSLIRDVIELCSVKLLRQRADDQLHPRDWKECFKFYCIVVLNEEADNSQHSLYPSHFDHQAAD